MKRGINLGLGRDRRSALARWGWLVVLVGTLLHGFLVRRTAEELDALREEVLRAQGSFPAEVSWSDDAMIRRLREIDASGRTSGHSPPAILDLIDSSLPPEMTLVNVAIRPIPPSAELMVDASAVRPEDVTLFQRNVAGSSLVASTRLLGEKRSAAGQLEIRLQVELRTP